MTKAGTKFYHFTSAFHLPSILADGLLRTTDPNLFSTGPSTHQNRETGEVITVGGPILGQPVVWLVDTPTVEAEAIGQRDLEIDKTGIRITVEVADARPWLEWLTARRHEPKWVARIIHVAGGRSSARHWYVVPRSIPRTEWVAIDDMRTGKPIPFDAQAS